MQFSSKFELLCGQAGRGGGAGERARAGDWKNCQLAPGEEAERTERFKAEFKAYDIMA